MLPVQRLDLSLGTKTPHAATKTQHTQINKNKKWILKKFWIIKDQSLLKDLEPMRHLGSYFSAICSHTLPEDVVGLTVDPTEFAAWFDMYNWVFKNIDISYYSSVWLNTWLHPHSVKHLVETVRVAHKTRIGNLRRSH